MDPPAKSSRAATVSLVLSWVGVGLAVLTVAAFVLPLISRFAVQIFFAALASAIAATVLAVIARRRHQKERRSTIALWVSVTGVVIGTLQLGVILVLSVQLGVFNVNVAEPDGHSVVQAYTSQGATLICDRGDNGYGIAHGQPFYEAYLDAPAALGTTAAARRALESAGVESPSEQSVSSWGEPLPAGAFAIGSIHGERSDLVTISSAGAVPDYCGGGIDVEGDNQVEPGRVLIAVQVAYPHRPVG